MIIDDYLPYEQWDALDPQEVLENNWEVYPAKTIDEEMNQYYCDHTSRYKNLSDEAIFGPSENTKDRKRYSHRVDKCRYHM